MSDIAMLMTGVLMTNQPFSSNLLTLPVTQLDQNIQKPIAQSYPLVSEVKAVSLKAMRLGDKFPITSLTLKSKPQKSRIAKIKEIFAKDADKFTKFQPPQAFTNKFSEKKRLIAKRFKDKLFMTKSQKAMLLGQPSSDDIVIVSSQRLTNQTLPNLRFSNSGVAVRVLQRLLMAKGYAVKVDGVFGALTESAVKAFQDQQDLTVDGIVGTKTWYYLTNYS